MRRMVGKRDRISRLIWDYGATVRRRYTFRDSARPKYFWRGAGKPTARFIPTDSHRRTLSLLFPTSSCRQSISCFSNNTARIALKNSTGSDDRWSPFLRDSKRWVDSFRKKRKKEEKREKKEWPRFDIKFFFFFFFIARKLSNLNSTSVPTPLKFRDSGTPTYARHPGQWNRKSERKKRPVLARSFIFSFILRVLFLVTRRKCYFPTRWNPRVNTRDVITWNYVCYLMRIYCIKECR